MFLGFCNEFGELSGLDWELVVANYIVVGVLQRVFGQVQEFSRMVAPDFDSLVASAWTAGARGSREALGHVGSSDGCCFTISIILQGGGLGRRS